MENAQVLDSCIVSKDKALLQFDRILDMLKKSYWAQNRPKNIVKKSIENSICYGIYIKDVQVGFARIITDYATAYYICDVIIDEAHREKGLGKKLINAIVNDEQLKSLFGILVTKDAHGLYEHFGFTKGGDRFMCKR